MRDYLRWTSGFETVATYKTRSDWWNTGKSYPTTQYWKKRNLAQFFGMQRFRKIRCEISCRRRKVQHILNFSRTSSNLCDFLERKIIWTVKVELYLSLLILVKLLDQKKFDDAKSLADYLITKISINQGHRRSSDPLNAKLYYYHRYYSA